jgi:hypothetical protein
MKPNIMPKKASSLSQYTLIISLDTDPRLQACYSAILPLLTEECFQTQDNSPALHSCIRILLRLCYVQRHDEHVLSLEVLIS